MKKNALKPWQKQAWCIPPEQEASCVCHMEEVWDVYKKPSDPQCPQVRMDEMSTQLIGEVRAPLAAEPGKPLRYDTEYKCNGTANIFIAFEPLAGQRYTKVTTQRTKIDWAHFIQELVDQHYPHVEKIRLVMHNLNTHTKASFYEAFDPAEAKRIADKWEIHSTPKQGSWFNMAEIELSHVSRQCLEGGIAAKATLINKVQAWNTQRNERRAKAHWQFTTDDARVKLRRLYPIVSTWQRTKVPAHPGVCVRSFRGATPQSATTLIISYHHQRPQRIVQEVEACDPSHGCWLNRSCLDHGWVAELSCTTWCIMVSARFSFHPLQGHYPFSDVVHKLKDTEVQGKFLLGHAPMRAQPTPKERPEAFHGIHMHFTKAIAIVIPVVLAPSMVDTLAQCIGVCRWSKLVFNERRTLP